MVNFTPSQLLKQPQEVIDICSTALGNPVADLSCCRSINMDDDFFNVSDRFVTAFHNNDDLRFPIEQLKENVTAYYETPSFLQDLVELILVHDRLNRHVSTLAKPRNDKFNQNKVHSMLLSVKKVDPRAPFAVAKNRLVDTLVMVKNFDDIRIFIILLWFQSFWFIEGHLVENQSEFILDMSRENFTKATAKLSEFFGSQLYSVMVSCLMEGITSELLPTHRALATQLSVYLEFFEHMKEVVKYGVQSPPKIKVATQHPTSGMNIVLCRVTSICFKCNFELFRAKSDIKNQCSTLKINHLFYVVYTEFATYLQIKSNIVMQVFVLVNVVSSKSNVGAQCSYIWTLQRHV